MIDQLDCAGHILDLSRTHVMGVLNVTPDSFSDGGRHIELDNALAAAREMVATGASIIDVGGESTRPGATPVSAAEELRRVLPIIEAIAAAHLDTVVSIDTSKPDVMRAAIAAGAGMINDVRALCVPGALQAAAECEVPVCLMHMRGEPSTMQDAPRYGDVIDEVCGYLTERVQACIAGGISRSRLLLDPGVGFGKDLDHNLKLIKHLGRIRDIGLPLLVGSSRKRMIGELTGAPMDQRLAGSVAAAVLAAWLGASVVRVHDVRATVEAIKVTDALRATS